MKNEQLLNIQTECGYLTDVERSRRVLYLKEIGGLVFIKMQIKKKRIFESVWIKSVRYTLVLSGLQMYKRILALFNSTHLFFIILFIYCSLFVHFLNLPHPKNHLSWDAEMTYLGIYAIEVTQQPQKGFQSLRKVIYLYLCLQLPPVHHKAHPWTP